MNKKPLTLSIVIPVYNEEHHLKNCLDAIAKQTIKPDEVIVVDNNSTDQSMAIAMKYPFVKIVKEPHQGRGYARTKGFNEAKGDIIGRLNADSYIMPTWVERVLADFQNPNLAAVTGLGKTVSLPRTRHARTTLWARVYYWYIHAYFRAMTTWGANMALRRSWWLKVKDYVNPNDTVVHEDLDVSLLIAGRGGVILQDNQLMITTNGQNYHYLPKLYTYFKMRTSTKKHHDKIGTLRRPEALLLGFWQTLPGRILCFVLGIPYVTASILLYPFDVLMLRYSKKRDLWLD